MGLPEFGATAAAEPTPPFRHTPRTAFERRLSLATDADEDFVRYRVMDRLEPVEPLSDRAFLACGIADLYGYLTTLLHRHDRLGMAASIKMRVPFIENRIIDFAIHLPRMAKLYRRQGKHVVKEAAVRRLPADIVYARKKGFPVPYEFVRGTGRLLLGGRLADELGWSRRATNTVVTILESDNYLCFTTVGLEMWLRTYFAGEKPEALGERLVSLAA